MRLGRNVRLNDSILSEWTILGSAAVGLNTETDTAADDEIEIPRDRFGDYHEV